jgi:hypothetical protein
MEAARDLAILWERAGSTVRPEEYTPIRMPTAAIPEPTLPTVEMAVDAYLSDARARGNSASAVYKKEGIFSRRFKVNPQKGRTEDSGEYIEPAFVLRGQGNQVSSGVGLGDALGMEGNMERELVGAV